MARAVKVQPFVSGEVNYINAYIVCGNTVVQDVNVWAAIYEVGVDGLTGTKIRETSPVKVEAILETSVPWPDIEISPEWVKLTLDLEEDEDGVMSGPVLDKDKQYFIVLQSDSDMAMVIGLLMAHPGVCYYKSGITAGTYPTTIEFQSDGSNSGTFCCYGTDESVDVRTTGNGLELVNYKGEWMCPKCKRTQMMEDESRPAIEAYRQEDDERARLGYIKTYPG